MELPPNKFNAARPGSLIGTITGALEHLSSLYANFGEAGQQNSTSTLQESTPTCPSCLGTGAIIGDIDPGRMLASELSLKKGAVLLWAGMTCGPVVKIKELANMIGIDFETPLAEQDKQFSDILLYGYDKEPVTYVYKKKEKRNYYRGSVFDVKYMRDAGTTSKGTLRAIKLFSHHERCPHCAENPPEQDRLIMGNSLSDVLRMPLSQSLALVRHIGDVLDKQESDCDDERIHDLKLRLAYLHRIGFQSLSAFDTRVSVHPMP